MTESFRSLTKNRTRPGSSSREDEGTRTYRCDNHSVTETRLSWSECTRSVFRFVTRLLHGSRVDDTTGPQTPARPSSPHFSPSPETLEGLQFLVDVNSLNPHVPSPSVYYTSLSRSLTRIARSSPRSRSTTCVPPVPHPSRV